MIEEEGADEEWMEVLSEDELWRVFEIATRRQAMHERKMIWALTDRLPVTDKRRKKSYVHHAVAMAYRLQAKKILAVLLQRAPISFDITGTSGLPSIMESSLMSGL